MFELVIAQIHLLDLTLLAFDCCLQATTMLLFGLQPLVQLIPSELLLMQSAICGQHGGSKIVALIKIAKCRDVLESLVRADRHESQRRHST